MKKVAGTVVYIESDRHLHKVMNQIFKTRSEDVRCFDCPASALNDPRTHEAALIIIDLDIPGLTLESYLARFKNIPFAVVGKGKSDFNLKKKEIVGCLSKPLDRHEIEALMNLVSRQKIAA